MSKASGQRQPMLIGLLLQPVMSGTVESYVWPQVLRCHSVCVSVSVLSHSVFQSPTS